MNCRTIRGFVATMALIVGGAMLIPSAQAQIGGMDSAKSKAMDAMSGAESPAAVYGKLLKGLSEEIIGAAEAMPADKYDFVPTSGKFDGVSSFGTQVRHLASANYGFFSGFGVSGAMDDSKLKSLKSKDELVEALKDSYAYAQKAIDTMTPQNAFLDISSDEGKMSRAGLATFSMAHSMDHYGQMVEYLRMNGIIPPASRKKS